MAPQPKRKISSRRQGKRRASIHFRLPQLAPCPNCSQLKPTHQVCPKCGFYGGREVVKIKIKEKKAKSKQP